MAMVPLARMTDHRIRLTDSDLALIVASLRARAAGLSEGSSRWHEARRLAERLAEGGRGNPVQRLGDHQRKAIAPLTGQGPVTY